ncbi:MAG: SUMF1/EgtB/PvdO family nonheme iron enzyme [Verrucomicrobia bacterium]|nr:SUMF1/EgtB/PvdO family nonheme iron enzyme [Verrucomicrobiota bacterium]
MNRRHHRTPYLYSHLLLACAGLALLLSAAYPAAATPLHKAVRDNDIGLVRDLLVNGEPGATHAVIGRGVTPLHLAVALDHVEAAELLIHFHASIEAETEGGFTPLHWAASRDATRCVRLLLDNGARIDALSIKGITPLHWAANRGATNAVLQLVGAGADVMRQTENGATPLHWAMTDDSSTAAEIIAGRVVEVQLVLDATNAAVMPADDDAVIADDDPVVSDPVRPEIYITPTTENSGRALIVDIGLGEVLVFEWVEALNVWAGKYEISNGQYRRFRPSHNSLFRETFSLDGNQQPVVNVSWHDAVEFCEWLNRTYQDRLPKDFHFRLPLALEWMALARCGENRIYPWGNRWPPPYGNFADLTAREQLSEWQGVEGYDDGFPVTCPVSLSGVNEWGIYGMAGNVWEWCQDWQTRKRRYKVRLGGSWDFDTEPNLRIETVGFDRPDLRDDTIGFRVFASLENPR